MQLASNTALHNLLSKSAASHPDATAILECCEKRTSYGELSDKSNEIAEHLNKFAIGKNRFIALLMQKNADAIAAIFGILKSGNAYIPLSSESPTTRLSEIIVDAKPSALITDIAALDTVRNILGDGWSLICVIGDSHALFQPSGMGDFAGENTAYCLYTSGSSGRPKGVVHTHDSALAFIDWCSGEFSICASDRFSSCAPLHFDLSIFDIFLAIKHGASVALFDADRIRKPSILADDLSRLEITIVYATPTLLRMLLNYGALKPIYSPKLVCFAGEIFPTKQLNALMEFWPKTDFYNLYGPTETNVCAFHKVSKADLARDQVPIGRACSGDILRLCPTDATNYNAIGELLVSGRSVMTSYWNAPSLTDGAFVHIDGKPWYKTGDIVEEIAPGEYKYIGRNDRMVKRRGYRIELNEIELALSHNNRLLENAVVSTVSEDGADVTLTCFFCARKKISALEIRKHCANLISLYMVPDVFRQLDVLPKTSTDKIDYMRLKGLVHALTNQ